MTRRYGTIRGYPQARDRRRASPVTPSRERWRNAPLAEVLTSIAKTWESSMYATRVAAVEALQSLIAEQLVYERRRLPSLLKKGRTS